jgi:hypothetical protein
VRDQRPLDEGIDRRERVLVQPHLSWLRARG